MRDFCRKEQEGPCTGEKLKGLFVVLCGYPHKNQRGIELKIILSIENDEEP